MLALPIFTARATILFSWLESSYRHAVSKCPVDTCRYITSPTQKEKLHTFVWSFVLALPIFTARKQLSSCRRDSPVGSDGSAACGRVSDLSEWQRSARDDGALSPRTFAGHRNRTSHRHIAELYKVKAPHFRVELCVGITYFHS